MPHLRIVLVGCDGQVGFEIDRSMADSCELIRAGRDVLDFDQPDTIRRALRHFKPDVVINAAAYTAVDKAEEDVDRAYGVNAEGPAVLAQEARLVEALLVHFSTDYVFDGNKVEPYLEEDAPGPLGVYGMSKLAGDEAVMRSGSRHLIFRVSWVYSSRRRNFYRTIRKYAAERQELRVVADQWGSPTWAGTIAETVSRIVSVYPALSRRENVDGLYHLAPTGQISWHGFASTIVDAMPDSERKCEFVRAIETSEYPTPARRPAYSGMSSQKLERTFGIKLPNWESEFEAMLARDERALASAALSSTAPTSN